MMMKAEVNSDELLADSIQIDNYLKQKKKYCSAIFLQDMKKEFSSYLRRYNQASPSLQFRIFLFTAVYGQKIKRALDESEEVSYIECA
ncbi:hypothetical protein HMPREF2542_07010 [Streptococcus sp. HMSC034B05]|uniref:hypothetical protein n=1 Tax=Streptococcus sp. HMSC034B05 TaxID=1715022 RepID=UPI0008C629F1|nr:hypothetical protein [Streptococcus sp. HMSC034B05]OFN56687.1 hypothetical protein HMPREF2542_07010 [Streptococcus sp. HMSC034B05]